MDKNGLQILNDKSQQSLENTRLKALDSSVHTQLFLEERIDRELCTKAPTHPYAPNIFAAGRAIASHSFDEASETDTRNSNSHLKGAILNELSCSLARLLLNHQH